MSDRALLSAPRLIIIMVMAVAAALLQPSAVAAQDVGTEDAGGCNVDVCIFLEGSGTTVDSWKTTAYPSGSYCGHAYFWRNDVFLGSSYQCGSGSVSATWSGQSAFSDGDVLCNTWSGVTGKPCKTIQA